jgi:hypothetical protein
VHRQCVDYGGLTPGTPLGIEGLTTEHRGRPLGIEEDTEGMVIVKTQRAHELQGATSEQRSYNSAWIPVNEDDIDMMHNTQALHLLPSSGPVEVMRQKLD